MWLGSDTLYVLSGGTAVIWCHMLLLCSAFGGCDVCIVLNPLENIARYSHVIQSRDTARRYSHVIHLEDTVTWYSDVIQLEDTVTWYISKIESHDTVTWYSSKIQSRDTVTWYSHVIQSCDTVAWYSHVVQSRDTVTWYSHVIQLEDTVTSHFSSRTDSTDDLGTRKRDKKWTLFFESEDRSITYGHVTYWPCNTIVLLAMWVKSRGGENAGSEDPLPTLIKGKGPLWYQGP